MTISKKGSRKITIGHEVLRLVTTPSSKGIIVLTAQHDEIKGQLIRVYIESDLNEFWVEFPYVESLDCKVVKPAEVAAIIIDAIKQGWNPRGSGSPISFNRVNNTLVEREIT